MAQGSIRDAMTLAAGGNVREALRVARSVSQVDQPAALLSNLGSLFSFCQCHAEALRCFEAAAAREPGNGTYFYNLATTQRAVGDLRGAQQSCDQAIRLNPRDYQALHLRSDLRTQTPATNHVSELEGLLAGASHPDEKALLCFALAKELEDIGEFARAFRHLQTGAHAYRSRLRYDVAEDVRVIRTIIESHTREALAAATRGYAAAAPVFVVGLPRSGTTLVERIIQSHTGIVSVGERNDFALQLVQLARASGDAGKSGRDTLVRQALKIDTSELGRRYIAAVTPEDAGARRVLDKMPINYLYCGVIHAALPQARIICVRRNPMDSCYAAFKAFLTGPYGFTYDLDELGRYFLAYRQLIDHWRETLPAQAYLEVHYEALVKDFEGQTRRMLDFLDLGWEAGIAGFHGSEAPSSTASAVQVRQPVYSTSIGRWRHYREPLAPLERMLRMEIADLDAPL